MAYPDEVGCLSLSLVLSLSSSLGSAEVGGMTAVAAAAAGAGGTSVAGAACCFLGIAASRPLAGSDGDSSVATTVLRFFLPMVLVCWLQVAGVVAVGSFQPSVSSVRTRLVP